MGETMRAAFLAGKRTIEVKEVARPSPGEGEVQIRVHYCGVCGSDVHLFQQGLPAPNILGHEFSGVIEEVGSAVTQWKPGDAVASTPGNPCGECPWCRMGQPQVCDFGIQKGYGVGNVPGAMAEYIVVNASSPRKLPEGVGLRKAALTEPLAVALHGVRISRMRLGDNVLVLGCGTIGLFTTLVLARCGVGALHVTDPSEAKRERALEMGADRAYDPEGLPPFHFHQIMGGVGPDVVYECVGIPQTTVDAVNYVKKGGQVLVLGVCMEPATMLPMVWNFKEIEIKGSFGMAEEFDMALSWLARGWVPVERILTRDVPLEEAQDALELLEGPNDAGKVLLRLEV